MVKMQPVEAGMISKFFNSIMDSFLKSLEGLFSSNNTKIKDEKGKITVYDESKPTEPIVDPETNKPLAENAAVFEMVITIQWPKDQVMTRKQAKELASEKDAWKKTIWDGADTIRLDMEFKGKDRYSKTGLNRDQLDKEIEKYLEKFDIKNTSTKRTRTVIFLFTEGEPQQESTEDHGNNNQGEANASNRLNVSLKKIVGKTNTSVRLIKINANYDIAEAMNDLDMVVSDDAFVDQLPEGEEVNYEITSDETDYDVNECEDFTCCDTVEQMIYDTLNVSTKMRVLGMAGLKYSAGTPILESGNIAFTFDYILAILADSLIDMGAESLPGFELITEETCICPEQSASYAIGLLESYLQSLGIVYDCLSIGSQYKLDQHISYLEDMLRDLKQHSST